MEPKLPRRLALRSPDGLAVHTRLVIVDADGSETEVPGIAAITLSVDADDMIKATASVYLDIVDVTLLPQGIVFAQAPPPPNAREAYERYTASSGGRNWQGLPCPTWDALPAEIRAHWRAAVGDRSVDAPR